MIKYALVCDAGHEFESWFRDSAAYDEQARRGFVTCPLCNSAKVSKAIMAPQVARTDHERRGKPAPVPAPAAAGESEVTLLDERQQALRAMIKHLHKEIVANTDDVGESFPEEARKIDAGEAPARAIRGKASLEDAKSLIEEGIDILPIPALPDERN